MDIGTISDSLTLMLFLLGIVLMPSFEDLPDTLECMFIYSTLSAVFLTPLKQIGGRRESMTDETT